MDDGAFLEYVADRLAALPEVQAVSLGGSRAAGTNRPDSDWDFGIYYRGHFDPQALRDLGWPGQVFEVGGWSDGVFNSGAWLDVDGRRTDVHYRELNTIDGEIAAARAGRFQIEPLMFHLAGIPSYLVLAELAIGNTLRGELPKLDYPRALSDAAARIWWSRAERTFDYARANHVPHRRVTQCAGMVALAATQAAHAVLGARAQWITNEKNLLTLAGLRVVDEYLGLADPDPDALRDIVDRSRDLCSQTLQMAKASTASGEARR